MAKRKKARERSLTAFLAGAEIFRDLEAHELERVASAGRIERVEGGVVLFRAGDPSDRLHVLLDGAIEILRETPERKGPVPVAYLTRGEVIGDMALFTGSPRRSHARVPEGARLWTLMAEDFLPLAESIPGLGVHLARVFAHRLETLIYHHRPHERPKELAGRLEHFDLPTVVQTLAASGQTGVLSIFDEHRAPWAEALLVQGEIERVRCGPLEGEDAFYEIFVRAPDGEFVFRASDAPDADGISREPIDRPWSTLLMEAMRRVDEVEALRARLPAASQLLKTRSTTVPWDDPLTEDVARAILTGLRTPRRLEELEGEVACPVHTLLAVAAKLHEAGHIR